MKSIVFLFTFFACQAFALNTFLFDPIQIVTNGSLGASLNSSVVDLNKVQTYSVQCAWTGGTAAGTIKLQLSNDIVAAGTSVTNWSDYTNTTQTIAGAGNYLWNIGQANYRWLRVAFTRTSGTGTLNCVYGKKGQ